MRPVDRGEPPKKDGQPVQFRDHKEARDPLITNIGDYCSYCEMPCAEGPDVEHVQPKKWHDDLRLEWTNLLLGCIYCNTVKGSTDLELDDYFWPDRDNTARAFAYGHDLPPTVAPDLSVDQTRLATNTLELTGLDRGPDHPQLTKKDRRWLKRREAWTKAQHARRRLQETPSGNMRGQIVDTAVCCGFWSVWMAVFEDDPVMRRKLIDAFRGTCGVNVCFGDATQLIERNGGRV